MPCEYILAKCECVRHNSPWAIQKGVDKHKLVRCTLRLKLHVCGLDFWANICILIPCTAYPQLFQRLPLNPWSMFCTFLLKHSYSLWCRHHLETAIRINVVDPVTLPHWGPLKVRGRSWWMYAQFRFAEKRWTEWKIWKKLSGLESTKCKLLIGISYKGDPREMAEKDSREALSMRKQPQKRFPQSLSLREKILFSRNVSPVESEFRPHSMDYLKLSLSQLRASSCFS